MLAPILGTEMGKPHIPRAGQRKAKRAAIVRPLKEQQGGSQSRFERRARGVALHILAVRPRGPKPGSNSLPFVCNPVAPSGQQSRRPSRSQPLDTARFSTGFRPRRGDGREYKRHEGCPAGRLAFPRGRTHLHPRRGKLRTL